MTYSPTAQQIIKAVKKLSASRWPFDYKQIFNEIRLDPCIQIDYSSHLWQWATSVAASGKWSEPDQFRTQDPRRIRLETKNRIRELLRDGLSRRQIKLRVSCSHRLFYVLLKEILHEEQAA